MLWKERGQGEGETEGARGFYSPRGFGFVGQFVKRVCDIMNG